MVEHIKALLPRLQTASFLVTSLPDLDYNCVAWAAGVADAWWWPLENPEEAHWPDGVPRVRTLEAFRAAFATLGYSVCSSEELEAGFEKVALFADVLGLPTHAAAAIVEGTLDEQTRQGGRHRTRPARSGRRPLRQGRAGDETFVAWNNCSNRLIHEERLTNQSPRGFRHAHRLCQ